LKMGIVLFSISDQANGHTIELRRRTVIRGQNFGLMSDLVPYVISGRKYVTSRPATEFRRKLVIGGNMNFFTGLRTPNCKRIGTGIVKDKVYWWLHQMPITELSAKIWESPLTGIKWNDFAYIEGFNSYQDLVDYFFNHPKKKLIREVGLICYKFDFSMERYTQKKLIALREESEKSVNEDDQSRPLRKPAGFTDSRDSFFNSYPTSELTPEQRKHFKTIIKKEVKK